MESKDESQKRSLSENVEELMEDVNEVVRGAVSKSSKVADSIGDNIRQTIKDTVKGAKSVRNSVVMVRVNRQTLERIDDLVEAGLTNSRSEAAAFLITEGVKSRHLLFHRISDKIEQIKQTKDELRILLQDEINHGNNTT